METITLSISKGNILGRVMERAEYIGAKMLQADENSFNRIPISEQDYPMLVYFINNTRSQFTTTAKRYVVGENDTTDDYTVVLLVPNVFSEPLQATMQDDFEQMFVATVAAKWFTVTGDADQATAHTEEGAAHLQNIMHKLHHKRAPERPTYDE